MGSPFIFNASRSKSLPSKGPLLNSGATLDNNGPLNYLSLGNFENNSTTGWSLVTSNSTGISPITTLTPGVAYAAAYYVFTVTSANATVGATFTNNSKTFTVVATISASTLLVCTGTGSPTGSGTLTKASGTGDSTIAFSAFYNTSPVGSSALSTVSSGQLRGSYSLSYAYSNGGVGEMIVSNAITIDLADQAKVLSFKFNYSLISDTASTNWSGTSSNTLGIYIYDITNGVYIQPQGVYNLVQKSGVGISTGTFQTTSNSTQYQLVIFNTSNSINAYTVYFDDFFLGPQTTEIGPAMSDWVAYTPTFTGFGSVTSVTVWSRRVGGSLEVQGNFVSGTPTAVAAKITLGYNGGNANVTLDSTLTSGVTGILTASAASSTLFGGYVCNNSGSNNYVTFGTQTSGTTIPNSTPINGNSLVGTGTTVSFQFSVPIVGWSSNTSMSSDTDTRVVAAATLSTPTSSAFNNTVYLIFPTMSYDTHTSYSTSTGLYTTPVSGYYNFSGNFGLNGSSTGAVLDLNIYVNGSSTYTFNPATLANGEQFVPFNRTIKLNAGDTVGFRWNTDKSSPSVSGGSTKNNLSIQRLSGPAVITATESVNAAYGLTSGVTPGANSVVKYDTKIKDTHAAFSTSTGLYTAPVSGTYQISLSVLTTSTTSNFYIKVAGTAQGVLTTADAGVCRGGSTIYQLNAGDTIGIYQETSAALTATSGSLGYFNKFSIARIGN